MIIHKSHSKTDLIDLINHLNLDIHFSHQDNKKSIHDKLLSHIKSNFKIDNNFFKIENKTQLISFLENKNPKKILSIKEKNNVMLICKYIINYCKNNYDLTHTKYKHYQDLIDDVDFIKQFGDIPSVRRCCRLMNDDIKAGGRKFNPLISPQVKKDLEEKKTLKGNSTMYVMTIRRATKDDPILVYFD
tara:strand:+ start:256 stop:819 length:564 start_codon:yes stop_codon:yes gene_type:complete